MVISESFYMEEKSMQIQFTLNPPILAGFTHRENAGIVIWSNVGPNVSMMGLVNAVRALEP